MNQTKTQPIVDDDLLELARNNLQVFYQLTRPGWTFPPHLDQLADVLMDVEAGKTRRTLINAPPRHGKTKMTSESFCAWALGRNPTKYFMFISHTGEFATSIGRNVRNIMTSPIYQLIFPNVRLSKDSKAKHRFSTTLGGEAYFVGVGGPITGKGAHFAVIDDPIKDAEQADSVAHKEMMKSWYREVMYTRLMPGASITIMSTRWREDDLHGWLLDPNEQEEIENWYHYNFPAIAEENEYWRNKCWRLKGQALWPEHYDLQALARIKSTVGTRSFMAMFQQRPQPIDGNIFKRSWFDYFDPDQLPENKILFRLTFWDTACEVEESNDFSACVDFAATATDIYVLDCYQEKLQFPELCRVAETRGKQTQVDALAIEKKSSGIQLAQTLKTFTHLPVIACNFKGDKEARAQAVSPTCEARKVHLARGRCALLLDDLMRFPFGKHDDLTDAFVGGLLYIRAKLANRNKKPAVNPTANVYQR